MLLKSALGSLNVPFAPNKSLGTVTSSDINGGRPNIPFINSDREPGKSIFANPSISSVSVIFPSSSNLILIPDVALPFLEEIVKIGERDQILEAIDAVGYIAFYSLNNRSLPFLWQALRF